MFSSVLSFLMELIPTPHLTPPLGKYAELLKKTLSKYFKVFPLKVFPAAVVLKMYLPFFLSFF